MNNAVLDRIRELESQLVDLWQSIGVDSEELAGEELQALELGIGEARYLVPIASVREVVALVWPQPLADAPDWIRGTTQYGEQTVPIIDLGRRLGGECSSLRLEHSMVILDRPSWIALIVDTVGAVVRVPLKRLSRPHPGVPQARFFLGTLSTEDGTTAPLLSPLRLADEYTSSVVENRSDVPHQ